MSFWKNPEKAVKATLNKGKDHVRDMVDCSKKEEVQVPPSADPTPIRVENEGKIANDLVSMYHIVRKTVNAAMPMIIVTEPARADAILELWGEGMNTVKEDLPHLQAQGMDIACLEQILAYDGNYIEKAENMLHQWTSEHANYASIIQTMPMMLSADLICTHDIGSQ